MANIQVGQQVTVTRFNEGGTWTVLESYPERKGQPLLIRSQDGLTTKHVRADDVEVI